MRVGGIQHEVILAVDHRTRHSERRFRGPRDPIVADVLSDVEPTDAIPTRFQFRERYIFDQLEWHLHRKQGALEQRRFVLGVDEAVRGSPRTGSTPGKTAGEPERFQRPPKCLAPSPSNGFRAKRFSAMRQATTGAIPPAPRSGAVAPAFQPICIRTRSSPFRAGFHLRNRDAVPSASRRPLSPDRGIIPRPVGRASRSATADPIRRFQSVRVLAAEQRVFGDAENSPQHREGESRFLREDFNESKGSPFSKAFWTRIGWDKSKPRAR